MLNKLLENKKYLSSELYIKIRINLHLNKCIYVWFFNYYHGFYFGYDKEKWTGDIKYEEY